ncbi:S8 family peptidase [Lysobacter sp. TAF61]|uniref:S8 family peptidase n=1 Tax=Lysobacter sp. TAF61 TaxID=3233072 RepID=UPI003F95BF8D
MRSLFAAMAVVLSAAATPASAQQARVNLSGMEGGGHYDRFIVKYRDGSSAQIDPAAMARSLESAVPRQGRRRGKGMALEHVRRMATGAEVISASRRLDRAEAASLMQRIASDPNVEYVEVDHLNQPTLMPDDPQYRRQWGLSGRNGINADLAWRLNDGSGTVVAVIDTGITRHSDLDENVRPGYDFISSTAISNDGDGRDSDPSDAGNWRRAGQCKAGDPARDSNWHGTHVAGTVAAVTGNGKGVAGVAHGAWIVPVRVLGSCGGYDSDVADAIIWASGGTVSGVPANANPAEVINLSLGHVGTCSATYQRAIDRAVGRGTTVVVAAGNDSQDVAGHAPANCGNVIAVAATNRLGRRAPFSNYGAGIDVAAPGVGILSTLNSGSTGPDAESYGYSSGTSMAAPHVAGVVAMIQSVSPTPKSPAAVEALLKATASAAKSRRSKPVGAGIVNANAALDAAIPPLTPVRPPDPDQPRFQRHRR